MSTVYYLIGYYLIGYYLIGWPGSGKRTVGLASAALMLHTDQLSPEDTARQIVERAR